MGGSIPPRSMDDRAKQLKVYMDCSPVFCMKNDEHAFDDRLRDILTIAKKIERLTQGPHVEKDEVSDNGPKPKEVYG